MNYRKLGKTNFEVSEIGMGTWQLSGDPGMWVGTDVEESYRALHRFVELGGNFLDTAWVYGYKDDEPDKHPSEEMIGKFLKETGARNKLIIASKIPPKNWSWPAIPGVEIDEVFPTEWIEKCIDDSLRSLGVDSIDLMQFHVWQDDFANRDEWKTTIEKIRKSGKVKFFGISANDYEPENCLKTLDTGLISTIQFIFNIFHQKPTEGLLPYAKKNNIGLIARVPLDEGGLSGKLYSTEQFLEGDFRKKYFGGKRMDELVKRTDKLKSMCPEAKCLPEMALRYILSFDEIGSVIPGMRKVEHVEANIRAGEKGKLSEGVMEELKKHAWERNFYL